MANARIRMPAKARAGEIVEIRALVFHPMESGFRPDNVGRAIPRHIVEHFVCTVGGEEVFRARFHPGIAANPFTAFGIVATTSAELVFTWTDDRGGVTVERAWLEVTGAG
jgi:sulfur-oxidizing protein SoxZ